MWAAYYAKIGFALLFLSAFGMLAIYVIRRKLELDRMASLRKQTAPEWLVRSAAALGGAIRMVGGVPALLIKTGAAETVIDVVGGQRLYVRVKPAQPFAGTLQVNAKTDRVGLPGDAWATGDGAFDALFVTRGEPAEFVKAALTAEVREGLARIAEGVRVAVGPSGAILRYRGVELQQALAPLAVAGQGIAESGPRGASVAAGGCVACGGAGPEAGCPSCKAPHHRACWDFAGRCACGASR
jgi:hypothetical protein